MRFIKPREYLDNWIDFIEACFTWPKEDTTVLDAVSVICIFIPLGVLGCIVGLRPGGDDEQDN